MQCVRNNIGQFYQTRYLDSASDFQSQHILGIRALCNINAGEGLYFDHVTAMILIGKVN